MRTVLPLTGIGAVLLGAPVLWFGSRSGPPPPANPAVVWWVAAIAAASLGYAGAMYRRCPAVRRPAVAFSRLVSFWYVAGAPFLVVALFFGPLVMVWLVPALPANLLGTCLLRRGHTAGMFVKLFVLLPAGAAGFVALTPAPDGRGKVVGDAWVTMAGWALLDLAVLLAAAVLATRRPAPAGVPARAAA